MCYNIIIFEWLNLSYMTREKKTRTIIRDKEGLEALANQLKSVRKRYGYTQERLAAECGLELSQISRIETSKINPTVSTMFRIARTLDIPVSHLFEFKLDKLDFTK